MAAEIWSGATLPKNRLRSRSAIQGAVFRNDRLIGVGVASRLALTSAMIDSRSIVRRGRYPLTFGAWAS